MGTGEFASVRDDSKANTGHEPIQVIDLSQISNTNVQGFLGIRKVPFLYGETEEHTIERIQKENAKKSIGYLTKKE
jgi:hypothetical protein